MSSGHRDIEPNEDHYRELKRISQLPWFLRGLAIKKQLVRNVEIPWLGGSSTDLSRIYIDHRFSGVARYRKEPINVAILVPAVVQHEGIEGILLVEGTDEAGKPYQYDGAHELATAAEEQKAEKIITQMGLRWDRQAYQDIFKPFIEVMATPPWVNLPADLNVTPYRDDDPAMFREIERTILHQTIRGAA